MQTRPHILVIGAGPAGSAAAYFLARGGARVTIIDKARFPRKKICGDGCSPRALEMMRRMGIESLPEEKTVVIRQTRLLAPDGSEIALDMPPERHHSTISREDLDELLLHQAMKAGAELREVTLEELEQDDAGVRAQFGNGESLRSDYAIGCDGVRSRARRALGLPRFAREQSLYGVRLIYENVTLSRPDAFIFYYREDLLPHYGWVFPLPGNRANAGILLAEDKLKRTSVKDLLQGFLAVPLIAEELKGARAPEKAQGAHLPMGNHAGAFAGGRVLLAGDAAGLACPISGEGIGYALETGELAARTLLAECEDKRSVSDEYDENCKRTFGEKFRFNGEIPKLIANKEALKGYFQCARESRENAILLSNLLLGKNARHALLTLSVSVNSRKL